MKRDRLIMILLATFFMILAFVPPATFAHSHKSPQTVAIRSNRHHHQNYQIIHWGKSDFYLYSDGSLIAHHYTHQTVRDFASLIKNRGIRSIRFIPVGSPGAIPHHLRDYAFWKCAEAGITVSNYSPSSSVIYWGSSTFYYDQYGRLFANHYNQQTIQDLVHFCKAMRYTRITLIPAGQAGAIPSHLRAYAQTQFQRAGIQVLSTQSHKGPKHKVRAEDVFVDIFLEMLSDRH